MNNSIPDERAATSASDRLVDGLDLWESEADRGRAAPLSDVRLDGNRRLLIPFTTSMVRATVHYLDYASLRGYVHCNAPDCLLCRIGRQQDQRDLWPVYDVTERAVAVLPVGPDMRPSALRPQLAPVLRQVREGKEAILLAVCKPERSRYIVSTQPLARGAEGAATIQAFLKDCEGGRVNLAGVFPRLANEDLARVPDVARILEMMGLDGK
jgi:hypothetical protein